MKTTLQVFLDARALIEKPENWCKKAYAVTADRHEVDPLNPHAKCFCMIGAVARASQKSVEFIENEASEYDALYALCARTPSAFNDSNTHTAVLAVFDKAIKAERAKVAA